MRDSIGLGQFARDAREAHRAGCRRMRMNIDRLSALLPASIGVGAAIITLYQSTCIWQHGRVGGLFLLGLPKGSLVWMRNKKSIVAQEKKVAAMGIQGNFCYLVPILLRRVSFVSDWQMMIMNSGNTSLRDINIRILKPRAGATPDEFIEACMHPVRRVHISILDGGISPCTGVVSPLNFTLKPDEYFIDIRTSTRKCYERLKPLKEAGYDISVVDRETGQKLCPPENQTA